MMTNQLNFTQPPEGYQTKRGCDWAPKNTALPAHLQNKPKQAPVCLCPMPADGPRATRFENDPIFNLVEHNDTSLSGYTADGEMSPTAMSTKSATRLSQAWKDLTTAKEIVVETGDVGRCGDMSSIMGLVKTTAGKQMAREDLAPSKPLEKRDFAWSKPFATKDDHMTQEHLDEILEEVGNTCMLRFKHFRKCMRKLDVDRSGQVDRTEFTVFFNTEFGIPHKVADQIFDYLNQPDENGHRDEFLDYNELMIVLGPYINPGAPPPVQLKPGNGSTGSVASIHMRKLG